jgi:hypothetical protein
MSWRRQATEMVVRNFPPLEAVHAGQANAASSYPISLSTGP